jgi:hypothetical protein
MRTPSTTLILIGGLITRTALAADIQSIQPGDVYYLYRPIGENERVIVKFVDLHRDQVKIQYLTTGAVDWVAPAKLLTQSDSDRADVETRVMGTALVVSAIACLANPDACKQSSRPSGATAAPPVTITLVNQHCMAVDYYVDNRLVVSGLPSGYQKAFSTTAGQKTVQVCNAGTQNACTPAFAQNWPSSATRTILPGDSCGAGQDRGTGDRPVAPTWRLDPLLPGAWRAVSASEQARILAELRNHAPQHASIIQRIARLRALELPFYRDAALYEGEIDKGRGHAGLFTFIRHSGGITLLDGTSPPIHELNRTAPLLLDTRQQATAYLRFFCAAIQGDAGTFKIVERPTDLDWSTEAPTTMRREAETALQPLAISRGSGNAWRAEATILYSDTLFVASFLVNGDGAVNMIDDRSESGPLPVKTARFTGPIRDRQ